ncbi:imidazole glycerol phosphate synthase subunit HisH [Candidatus Bathyarchaeota archaeon]|nr:MAG: imidazole glycerol phosphate synthase subunit HisH [Candidatus Bathyarchaeota archaeon]
MVIIDYGVGNLFSITCGLRKIGLDAEVSSEAKSLSVYDGIVLPGVGNFKSGAEKLRLLKEEIARCVKNGTPILGICLGMHLLFEKSREAPGRGLGLLRGETVRLPKDVKTPHIGWNNLHMILDNELLNGIDEKDYFYFVHGYYAKPENTNIVVAETEYGVRFPSVIAKRNIYGTQFHPEKSGKPGRRVLMNFAEIIRR